MARFIQIAMGSAAELSHHLLVARDLGLIERGKVEALENSASEVSRMLAALGQCVREHDRLKPRAKG